jgi:hypothetical protein
MRFQWIWWTGDFSLMIMPFRLKPLCCFRKQLQKSNTEVRNKRTYTSRTTLPFQDGICSQHDIIFLQFSDIGFARTSMPNKNFQTICMGLNFIPPLHDGHSRPIVGEFSECWRERVRVFLLTQRLGWASSHQKQTGR